MNATSLLGKIAYRLVMELLWRIPLPLPLDDKKVVCSSFGGAGYGDNPAAIADQIAKQDLGYKIVWAVKDQETATTLPGRVMSTRFDSLSYIYHMRTAKFWIDNCRKMPYVRKRRNQLYIQTWHGFPLKKIEKDAALKLPAGYIKMAERDSRLCDLMVSNSTFLSNIYRDGFWYDGEIIECGSPRNDMLFEDATSISAEVKKSFSIPSHKKILLYAPTFRSDMELAAYDVDYKTLLKELDMKFGGEWIVVVRLHPLIAAQSGKLGVDNETVFDGSAYPQMQQLLAAADALVTDYSSSMFDFMLTQKPCFLYAKDISAYKGDRGFYYEMAKLPFFTAETNASLVAAVDSFNADTYRKRINTFMKEFDIHENGTASKEVVRWMVDSNNA